MSLLKRPTSTSGQHAALLSRNIENAIRAIRQAARLDAWYWPPVFLSIVSLVIYLQGLGTVSVWFDEAWSYGLARQHVGVMQHYLWGVEQNMALYYILLHIWLNILSVFHIPPSEFWLRLPSVLCASMSVVVVYSFGERFFGRVAAITAALLFMLNGWTLYAAQQARSYALQLLLICLAWNALLVALSSSSRRERLYMWIGYSALMTLAVYAHLFSLLIFAAQLILIALLFLLPGPWSACIRQSWRMVLSSVSVVVVLIMPILIDAKTHGGNNLFVPIPQPAAIYKMFVILTQGTMNPFVWYLIAAASTVAVVAAIHAYVRNSRVRANSNPEVIDVPDAPARRLKAGPLFRTPGTGVLAMMCWILVPVILSYSATQQGFNLHLFYQRYLLVIVPAICLLAGVGIAALRWRSAELVIGLLLVVLVANNLPHLLAAAQEQDFRTGMAWVQHEYQAGDGLACAPAINCGVPMAYYLDAYPGPAHFDADSPGIWRWPLHSPTFSDLAALQRYAAKHRRLFFFTLRWNPGRPLDATTQAMQQWLTSHYQLAGRMETSTGSVYLYIHQSAGT